MNKVQQYLLDPYEEDEDDEELLAVNDEGETIFGVKTQEWEEEETSEEMGEFEEYEDIMARDSPGGHLLNFVPVVCSKCQ